MLKINLLRHQNEMKLRMIDRALLLTDIRSRYEHVVFKSREAINLISIPIFYIQWNSDSKAIFVGYSTRGSINEKVYLHPNIFTIEVFFARGPLFIQINDVKLRCLQLQRFFKLRN